MKHVAAALGILAALSSGAARADTVTDWNRTSIEVLKAANVSSNPASRSLAMVHVAMSDAINAVQDRYARYLPDLPTVRSASAEAAAAGPHRLRARHGDPADRRGRGGAHLPGDLPAPDIPRQQAGAAPEPQDGVDGPRKGSNGIRSACLTR